MPPPPPPHNPRVRGRALDWKSVGDSDISPRPRARPSRLVLHLMAARLLAVIHGVEIRVMSFDGMIGQYRLRWIFSASLKAGSRPRRGLFTYAAVLRGGGCAFWLSGGWSGLSGGWCATVAVWVCVVRCSGREYEKGLSRAMGSMDEDDGFVQPPSPPRSLSIHTQTDARTHTRTHTHTNTLRAPRTAGPPI